ncbi:transcriptional regulator NrdR [Myxococcota bacterium]|jgi:transcriptional repressor NrdR|nr:transcriptional regulator NrdR [Myxococcota bacterium]
MLCPFCKNEETRVVDSRVVKDTAAVRRRRACDRCERRFTTYERVEELLPAVVKRDSRREPFDREKIRRGIKLAFKKRNMSEEAIDALVDGIERQFQDHPEREVQSVTIGEAVMESLRKVDEVAYVRFASVYRQFRDVNEFMAELTRILSTRTQAPRPDGAAGA